MTPPSDFDEKVAIFTSAMVATAIKLVRASSRPSIWVVIGEVLVGLTFCFILAPAMQEYFNLSVKIVCAITWFGALFSGILLQGAEVYLKAWLDKITPTNKKDDTL